MQEQRKSNVSAKVESWGADDDGQRLLTEVRQPLAVCVDCTQKVSLSSRILSKRGERVRVRKEGRTNSKKQALNSLR